MFILDFIVLDMWKPILIGCTNKVDWLIDWLIDLKRGCHLDREHLGNLAQDFKESILVSNFYYVDWTRRWRWWCNFLSLVVYHLPQIPGNSLWDVNIERFLYSSHWKIPGTNRNSEKVVPFSRLGGSEWKFVYHLQVSWVSYQCHVITRIKSSMAWQSGNFRPMVNDTYCCYWLKIPNQNLGIFFINGKQPVSLSLSWYFASTGQQTTSILTGWMINENCLFYTKYFCFWQPKVTLLRKSNIKYNWPYLVSFLTGNITWQEAGAAGTSQYLSHVCHIQILWDIGKNPFLTSS